MSERESRRPHFTAAARADLEREARGFIVELDGHIRDLRDALRSRGGLDAQGAGRLLAARRVDTAAAADLATLAWPTLQAHAALMDLLDRTLRLTGHRPSLADASPVENIELLRDGGLCDATVCTELFELNALRNELTHHFAAMTGAAFHRLLGLVLTAAGRLGERFGSLFAAAGLDFSGR